MGTEYAHDKFCEAVRALATSSGSIKERLVEAITYIAGINTELDMPQDLAKDFNEFVQRVTAAGSPNSDEGAIHDAVWKMTENEAVETAREIVWLAHQFESARSGDAQL